MTASKPRVIFDCNVLVQAVMNPAGPSARCVRLVEDGVVTLVTSRAALAEAGNVLNRPAFRAVNPALTPEFVEAFLKALAYRSDYLRDVPQGPGYGRDSDDEPYLDLAIVAAVDFLVTSDNDLLSLPESHTPGAKEFRHRHQNQLVILRPQEFLDAMATRGS